MILVVRSSCMNPSCLYLACTSNQWTCSDGSCIPQEQRCNERYDCPDYTDEYNCTGNIAYSVIMCMWEGILLSLLQQCSLFLQRQHKHEDRKAMSTLICNLFSHTHTHTHTHLHLGQRRQLKHELN